ncbi:hypothetical protein JCGZ_05802 [Jatropha curcas]|uniref:Uncharacterized protein n=1 Tax=Jatropha curcas TaxID=180498 RepID=A0A067KTJ8_JATCU|nr:hypothetical protein JCGZ_05802 [Jatropha curcas]
MLTWSEMNRMVAGEMLEMRRGPVMSWCQRKVEEQETRRDFPIEGSRGSPASSACARNERGESKGGRNPLRRGGDSKAWRWSPVIENKKKTGGGEGQELNRDRMSSKRSLEISSSCSKDPNKPRKDVYEADVKGPNEEDLPIEVLHHMPRKEIRRQLFDALGEDSSLSSSSKGKEKAESLRSRHDRLDKEKDSLDHDDKSNEDIFINSQDPYDF